MSDFLLYTLAAVAPGIFWLIVIYLGDRVEPEPTRLVIWTFIAGGFFSFLGAIMVWAFQSTLFGDSVTALDVVVFAPIIEEPAKLIVCIFFLNWIGDEFDEPMDGIVYASAVALGFATFENMFYVSVFSSRFGIGSDSWWDLVGLRALLTVPSHALASAVWGFALGRARFAPEKARAGIIVLGLVGGIVLHGIFNYIAVAQIGESYTLLMVQVAIEWGLMIAMVVKSLSLSPHRRTRLLARGGGERDFLDDE
ncbi:MAG: PrsW family intramembrane metalloprotease [SAR324 cluster bacterium]|nr:PrsW family intramembrane metalloprotease [SAR324 cluster bacterium]MCH8886037.1 PrsW family intramembrane metalloprotease [SAR324 cluster bacterium]